MRGKKNYILKTLQYIKLMFSGSSVASSKRIVGTLIIIDVLVLIDVAISMQKPVLDNEKIIVITLIIAALILWGYSELLKIFGK